MHAEPLLPIRALPRGEPIDGGKNAAEVDCVSAAHTQ